MFLRTCCCGCTLRTGSISIGVFSLIFSALSFLLLSYVLIGIEHPNESSKNATLKYATNDNGRQLSASEISDLQVILKKDVELRSQFTANLNNSSQNYQVHRHQVLVQTYGLTGVIAIMVASAFSLIVSILLVIGAVKGYMWLLMPWIVYCGLSVILTAVSCIYQLVKMSNLGMGGVPIFVSAISVLLVLVLDFYLLMVVISHFQELKKKKEDNYSEFGKISLTPSSIP